MARRCSRVLHAWLPPWRRLNPEPLYRWVARTFTYVVFRPHYEGFEHLPERGPALLVANHVSYVDGLVIAAACKRPVRFIIDEEIYRLPGIHYFMRHNRAIPIMPTRASVAKALDTIAEGLRDGDLICIFPEGQLTYTGHLGRFRPGIEWMVRRTPVPVYPVALMGLWGSIFSRKYRKGHWRWLPRLPLRRVRAICTPAVPPQAVHCGALQRTILDIRSRFMEL